MHAHIALLLLCQLGHARTPAFKCRTNLSNLSSKYNCICNQGKHQSHAQGTYIICQFDINQSHSISHIHGQNLPFAPRPKALQASLPGCHVGESRKVWLIFTPCLDSVIVVVFCPVGECVRRQADSLLWLERCHKVLDQGASILPGRPACRQQPEPGPNQSVC